MVYKKGFSPVLIIIFFVFFVFAMVFVLGIFYFIGDKTDELMNQIGGGVVIGEVDFNETYTNTFRQGVVGAIDTLHNLALALIIGMVGVMLIVGYNFKGTSRLWIVLDIFIIIVVFIVAVYLSRSFDTFINADGELFEIYSNNFEDASRFVLNLPLYVPIIGVLVMLATYATVRRREPNVLEFQR